MSDRNIARYGAEEHQTPHRHDTVAHISALGDELQVDVPLRGSDYDRIELAGRVSNLPADTWTVLTGAGTPDSD